MKATFAYLPFWLLHKLTYLLGIIMVWFAEGYNNGSQLEKQCCYIPWLIFRILFKFSYFLSKKYFKVFLEISVS
jgi:hypothetical protein